MKKKPTFRPFTQKEIDDTKDPASPMYGKAKEESLRRLSWLSDLFRDELPHDPLSAFAAVTAAIDYVAHDLGMDPVSLVRCVASTLKTAVSGTHELHIVEGTQAKEALQHVGPSMKES